jgi:hypothetical protein
MISRCADLLTLTLAGLNAKRKPLIGECKSRAAAFSNLYKWLEGYDFLVIKKDRHDSLIVMSARLLARLLAQIPR